MNRDSVPGPAEARSSAPSGLALPPVPAPTLAGCGGVGGEGPVPRHGGEPSGIQARAWLTPHPGLGCSFLRAARSPQPWCGPWAGREPQAGVGRSESHALRPGYCWPRIKSHPWVRAVASAVSPQSRVGRGQLRRPEVRLPLAQVWVTGVLAGGWTAQGPQGPRRWRGARRGAAEGGVGQHELYQRMGVYTGGGRWLVEGQ